MELVIKNCNNIDFGKIQIIKSALNIKYAMNGVGKSTIARAIEMQSKNDGSLKILTPFKHLNSKSGDNQPQISGLEGIKSVAIFNDSYISQFAFRQDEILTNSFEIFVKTADYEKRIQKIESLIHEIKITFTTSKEIDQVIIDLTTLGESFGKSKSGYSEAGILAKGIGKGNKVANIPKGLESYTEYLKSPLNSKWLRWQMDGNNFAELSEKCPYCTSSTTDKKAVISKVSEEFDAKSIEHLNKIIAVIESLGKYFSAEANQKLDRITKNINGLSKEEISYLRIIKEQVDTLKIKMLDLKGITYFSMKDSSKVADYIDGLKIDLTFLSELNSKSTSEIVERLNNSLKNVLQKIGLLQGEIALQNRLVKETIEENSGDINEFLKYAGYKYNVEVEYSAESYKMRLKHFDSPESVESGSQHLSYGEKNAFSLVLFMYECLSKNPNIIILDDPISSFDRNKKYAVIDMLFRGKRSLRNKTVLLLTHDIEPVIDILYTLPHKFNSNPPPYVTFLESKNGTIKEIPILKQDISTFGKICDDNIAARSEEVIKLIYLRRYYEILDNKDVEYNLLANLLHKRATPVIKSNGSETPMTAAEINEATIEIKKKMPTFDYNKLLANLSSEEYMKAAYKNAECDYEKLQLFRVLKDRYEESDVINKFINESFHIENEYIMQINPCKYEIIPAFIIEECNKLVLS